jgi:hypothetical protein
LEEEGLDAPTFLPVLVFRATVLLADALAGDAPAAAFGDELALIVLIFCDPLLKSLIFGHSKSSSL